MADTVLASLEPEEKEYRELDGDGLSLPLFFEYQAQLFKPPISVG
jgi:hypothetical protein